MGVNYSRRHISASRRDRTTIPTAAPPFLTTAIPMALTGILTDFHTNGKYKLLAYKLVVSIKLLADDIGQFQRQTLFFRCPLTPQRKLVRIWTKPEVENAIWWPPYRKYLYLSIKVRYKRNCNAKPTFSRSTNRMGLVRACNYYPTKLDVVNPIWLSLTYTCICVSCNILL